VLLVLAIVKPWAFFWKRASGD